MLGNSQSCPPINRKDPSRDRRWWMPLIPPYKQNVSLQHGLLEYQKHLVSGRADSQGCLLHAVVKVAGNRLLASRASEPKKLLVLQHIYWPAGVVAFRVYWPTGLSNLKLYWAAGQLLLSYWPMGLVKHLLPILSSDCDKGATCI